MPRNSSRPAVGRRRARRMLVALTVPALLASCSSQQTGDISDAKLARTEIPAKVSPKTRLVVGAPEDRVVFRLSGLAEKLPFTVEWANISGGPQCSEAFRAQSLDLCASAEVPSMHAHWTGLGTKLVAAEERANPRKNPIYRLGIAPGAGIESLKDLRGEKIAFSPGQAQGALVLRVLRKAGLKKDDVTLVEMPSTPDVYTTALGERQVDAAPLGGVDLKRYPAKYGRKGGRTLAHGLRDDASHLWAPTRSVADPRKAAAVREFVRLWARAQQWAYEHREEWVDGYAVKDQGLSRADGAWLHEHNGKPRVPGDWTDVIRRHQRTVDLIAKETGRRRFDAETLFDRRFEHVAGDALKGFADREGKRS